MPQLVLSFYIEEQTRNIHYYCFISTVDYNLHLLNRFRFQIVAKLNKRKREKFVDRYRLNCPWLRLSISNRDSQRLISITARALPVTYLQYFACIRIYYRYNSGVIWTSTLWMTYEVLCEHKGTWCAPLFIW